MDDPSNDFPESDGLGNALDRATEAISRLLPRVVAMGWRPPFHCIALWPDGGLAGWIFEDHDESTFPELAFDEAADFPEDGEIRFLFWHAERAESVQFSESDANT